MGAAKRKPATLKAKHKEEVNKKAIAWVSSIVGVVFIAIAALLIFTS